MEGGESAVVDVVVVVVVVDTSASILRGSGVPSLDSGVFHAVLSPIPLSEKHVWLDIVSVQALGHVVSFVYWSVFMSRNLPESASLGPSRNLLTPYSMEFLLHLVGLRYILLGRQVQSADGIRL